MVNTLGGPDGGCKAARRVCRVGADIHAASRNPGEILDAAAGGATHRRFALTGACADMPNWQFGGARQRRVSWAPASGDTQRKIRPPHGGMVPGTVGAEHRAPTNYGAATGITGQPSIERQSPRPVRGTTGEAPRGTRPVGDVLDRYLAEPAKDLEEHHGYIEVPAMFLEVPPTFGDVVPVPRRVRCGELSADRASCPPLRALASVISVGWLERRDRADKLPARTPGSLSGTPRPAL